MGGMVMGKCKDRQRKSCIVQIDYNISKEDMENYNWAMFTHAMDFFKERTSLKNLILEHFFTNLLNNLSIEDLVTHDNLISTKFMKPKR
jgi:hypothetical protein